MRKRDPDMYNRLREEIYKLGDSNKIAAQKLGVEAGLIYEWLNYGYMPSVYYFKNFYYAGCDIIYILTGERTNHET